MILKRVKKRKICVVIYSRANYGRIKTVLKAIKKNQNLDLQIVLGGSSIIERVGDIRQTVIKDGFKINSEISMIVEGSSPSTMAKSTGLAIIELSNVLSNLKPDFVLTIADRYETISTAITASYMNIPVAHTQGGEVTGSIDESVRHAITKLSHVHFPATKLSKKNILQLGENPKMIFLTGCPSIDIVRKSDRKISQVIVDRYKGSGSKIDINKPYVVILQHPVTTEYNQQISQIEETINAIKKLDIQKIWLWPNIDAGSDFISKRLRIYKENIKHDPIHFFKNFSPEDYIRLIANTKCLIGNSSSGLREGSYLGIPVVNIGTRQAGREHGKNVLNVSNKSTQIFKAINKQLNVGKYAIDKKFGDGFSGERIAKILEKVRVNVQKKLTSTIVMN